MNRKKILLIISNLEFGGAQRQVIELANNLDREQYEVHVCSLSDYVPLSNLLSDDVQLHIITKYFKFDITVPFRLALLYRKEDYKLVNSYLFDAEIAASIASAISFTNIKNIGSERNTNYTLKRIQRFFYRATDKFVDLIIANSTSGANFRALETEIRPIKIRVVYNGVDTDKFQPASLAESRKFLGIPADSKVVGMFASFKEQKNQPLLLLAIKQILDKQPKIKILFVGGMLHGGLHGSNHYAESIFSLVKELGLQDNCIMLGNRNDVERIYPACDFTVLPSLYEGTPNVVLESMACGVPCLASNVSDNMNIISDGDDGRLFDIGAGDVDRLSSIMQELLSNTRLLDNYKEAARETAVSKFSTRELAENTGIIYSEIL